MNNSSSTDSRRILVLGGDGFVGTNVVGVLREEGLDPTILSRKTGIDLRQRAAVGDFLSDHKPDFIVNCAAHVGSLNYVTQQAADVIYDNSLMLLNLYQSVVDACPNAVIINPIANCAYPATSTTFREDEWWNGHLHRSVLSYGATRRHMWAISECYEMQHNVRTVSLLVPNMYGPHDSEDPNKAHAPNHLCWPAEICTPARSAR
ncbi:MAG: NAD-dependent epimerase/dehydratase family protein, partial [Planctomycetota bacterium]